MGWSGCAMVLGKLPVPGRPTRIIIRQRPTTLAVGTAGGLFGHFFFRLSFLFFLPLSGRRLDTHGNTVSKARKATNNQPTKIDDG